MSKAHYNTLSIFGAPGTGKTSLAIALLKRRKIERYAVLDPFKTIPAAESYRDLDQFEREFEAVSDRYWLDLNLAGQLQPFSIALVPRPGADEAKIADRMAQLALWRKNMTLIVDEAHDAAPNRGGPTTSLHEIARRGRHYDAPEDRPDGIGVSLWLISQRPADVDRSLTAAGERFIFWCQERGDYEYLRATLGRTVEGIVRELRPGEFIAVAGREIWRGKVAWVKGSPKITRTHVLDLAQVTMK